MAQLLKFIVLHIFPMFIFFKGKRVLLLHHSKREPSYETLFLSLFFKRKVRHKETKQFAQACAVELSWDFMIFDCKLRLLKSISVTYKQTFTQDNLIFANYRGRKSARVCIKHVALKTTGSLWPCACSELDMKVPREPCLRDEDWKCYSWPFGVTGQIYRGSSCDRSWRQTETWSDFSVLSGKFLFSEHKPFTQTVGRDCSSLSMLNYAWFSAR